MAVSSAGPNPIAYFITFSCYGKRLHGEGAETVDRRRNAYDTPFVPPSVAIAEIEEAAMTHPPFILEVGQREIVLRAIQEVCSYRTWRLWAAHVRSDHVHVVAGGQHPAERIMNDFKAYASRALNRRAPGEAGGPRWARHGSTVYLWTPTDVSAAVDYVIRQQGEPMACWENPHKEL
jgi:REP element-mobilizing transposase RayT